MSYPHIMGGEKEYGFFPTDFFPNGKKSEQSERHKIFFHYAPIMHLINYTRAWLENGGLLYIDTNNHPEYASPECRNAREVVTWMKAGDEIMARIVEKIRTIFWNLEGEDAADFFGHNESFRDFCALYVNACTEKYNLPHGSEIFRIHRNSIDVQDHELREQISYSDNILYGEHENHSVQRRLDVEELFTVLLLHYVSRFWQGSGRIYCDADTQCYAYRLWQRETRTGSELVGTSTTAGFKPIIDKARPGNDSLADKTEWTRVHIIGGDANMAEVASRLKWGTTALLIQLFQEGYFKDKSLFINRQTLRDYYRVFALDVTLRKTCSMWGNEYTARNLQQILLDYVRDFFEKGYGEKDEEVCWQLEWWQKILDLAACTDPLVALAPYTDVGQKYFLIMKDMERYGYSWQSLADAKLHIGKSAIPMTVRQRLRWWDLEYHRISKRYGIFQKLPMARVCTDDEIAHAMHNSPLGTRAIVRSNLLKKLRNVSANRIDVVDWQAMSWYDSNQQRTVWRTFNDPFDTDLSILDAPTIM